MWEGWVNEVLIHLKIALAGTLALPAEAVALPRGWSLLRGPLEPARTSLLQAHGQRTRVVRGVVELGRLEGHAQMLAQGSELGLLADVSLDPGRSHRVHYDALQPRVPRRSDLAYRWVAIFVLR